MLLPGCCCQDVAARMLLPDCCCQDAAARLLLPSCCCQAAAARMLLPGSNCRHSVERCTPRGIPVGSGVFLQCLCVCFCYVSQHFFSFLCCFFEIFVCAYLWCLRQRRHVHVRVGSCADVSDGAASEGTYIHFMSVPLLAAPPSATGAGSASLLP